jgi:hypothetical protein
MKKINDSIGLDLFKKSLNSIEIPEQEETKRQVDKNFNLRMIIFDDFLNDDV